MKKLTERVLFDLYISGKTYKEIAEIIGLTIDQTINLIYQQRNKNPDIWPDRKPTKPMLKDDGLR